MTTTHLVGSYRRAGTYSGNRTGEQAARHYLAELRREYPEYEFTLSADSKYYHIHSKLRTNS